MHWVWVPWMHSGCLWMVYYEVGCIISSSCFIPIFYRNLFDAFQVLTGGECCQLEKGVVVDILYIITCASLLYMYLENSLLVPWQFRMKALCILLLLVLWWYLLHNLAVQVLKIMCSSEWWVKGTHWINEDVWSQLTLTDAAGIMKKYFYFMQNDVHERRNWKVCIFHEVVIVFSWSWLPVTERLFNSNVLWFWTT